MGKLDQEIFVCVDCETTGLDTEKDRIIEVAVIKFTLNEILESYETLVDPECPIPVESTAIHNIIDSMVVGKPKIKEVLPKVIEMIGGHVVMGHGVGFDLNIIMNSAKRHDIRQKLKSNKVVDSLRLARLYGQSPINSLQHLRKHFNVQQESAHRAMGDVVVNIEVFKHLVSKFRNTEDLFKALARPIPMKNMPLGKHKGRPMKEIPLNYLLWAANKDFDRDLLYTIRSEIKRRKQGNQFSQAGNPFQDL